MQQVRLEAIFAEPPGSSCEVEHTIFRGAGCNCLCHDSCMTSTDDVAVDWQSFFSEETVAQVLSSDVLDVEDLWGPLGSMADSYSEEKELLLVALAKIASLSLRPDDWNYPYGPALQSGNRRSPIPDDLTDTEQILLNRAVSAIPHGGLKARVLDILFLFASGPDKFRFAKAYLEVLVASDLPAQEWASWRYALDRGLSIAKRYGRGLEISRKQIEGILRGIVHTSSEGYTALQAAEILAKHGQAAERAATIARRLRRLADRMSGDQKRSYLRGATEWFVRAGDPDAGAQLVVEEVRDLIDQAQSAVAFGGSDAIRAGHFYERALQRVRVLSRAERSRLGVEELPGQIVQRIREAGVLSVAAMNVFESPSIDLTDTAQGVRDHIANKPADEALLSFVGVAGFFVIDDEIAEAERSVRDHPLRSLITNIHFSADGRIVYRSAGQGGPPVYEYDPSIWDALIQKYELRMKLLVHGVLWPGWVQLTNEHRFSTFDLMVVVSRSGIVPADRCAQFTKALHYGFNGDFSTAMQLLAPQIEALVRQHLANAGEQTSTIDPATQVETEIGLSALMGRSRAGEILTPDLAFEIRAIFCGPSGPNVRNDVAHGLISDQVAAGGTSLYVWWFCLRLVYLAFWNAQHDTDASESRTPRMPGDSAGAVVDEE